VLDASPRHQKPSANAKTGDTTVVVQRGARPTAPVTAPVSSSVTSPVTALLLAWAFGLVLGVLGCMAGLAWLGSSSRMQLVSATEQAFQQATEQAAEQAANQVAQQCADLTHLVSSRSLRRWLHEAQLQAHQPGAVPVQSSAQAWASLLGPQAAPPLLVPPGGSGALYRSLLLADSSGRVLAYWADAAGKGTAPAPLSVAPWPLFGPALNGLVLSHAPLTALPAQTGLKVTPGLQVGLPVHDVQGHLAGVLMADLAPWVEQQPASAVKALAPPGLATWLGQQASDTARNTAHDAAPFAWGPQAASVAHANAAAPELNWLTVIISGILHPNVQSLPGLPSWALGLYHLLAAQSLTTDLGLLLVTALLGAFIWRYGSGPWWPRRRSAAAEAARAVLDNAPTQPLAVRLQEAINAQLLFAPHSQLALHVAAGLEQARWPMAVEQVVWWVARQGMHNTAQHTQPGAVVVRLASFVSEVGAGMQLELHDTGFGLLGPSSLSQHAAAGAPANTAWPRDLDQHASMQAMRERALSVGARLTLRSERGFGTRLILRWLPSDAGSET
jgi:hypothetical protein